MIQWLMFGVIFAQITFSVMAMDNRLAVVDFYGDVVLLEEWKVKESRFLHQRYCSLQDNLKLNIPIGAGLLTKKELELFSRALDWKRDMTLLYYYVRLPIENRYMLIDVINKSKLDADELSYALLMFHGTGLYMKELMNLQKNTLLVDLSDILPSPETVNYRNCSYPQWCKNNWLQYREVTLEPQVNMTTVEQGKKLIKKHLFG